MSISTFWVVLLNCTIKCTHTHIFCPLYVRGDPNAATTSDVLLTGNSIDFSLSNIIIREFYLEGGILQKTFKKNPTLTLIWVGTSTDSVVCILLHFFPGQLLFASCTVRRQFGKIVFI